MKTKFPFFLFKTNRCLSQKKSFPSQWKQRNSNAGKHKHYYSHKLKWIWVVEFIFTWRKQIMYGIPDCCTWTNVLLPPFTPSLIFLYRKIKLKLINNTCVWNVKIVTFVVAVQHRIFQFFTVYLVLPSDSAVLLLEKWKFIKIFLRIFFLSSLFISITAGTPQKN